MKNTHILTESDAFWKLLWEWSLTKMDPKPADKKPAAGSIFWRALRFALLPKQAPKTRIVFGFVSRPIGRNNFGQAIVDNFADTGIACDFALAGNRGPYDIKPGLLTPLFGKKLLCQKAMNTDTLVLEVHEQSGQFIISRWGFQEDWKKAESNPLGMVKALAVNPAMPKKKLDRDPRFTFELKSFEQLGQLAHV